MYVADLIKFSFSFSSYWTKKCYYQQSLFFFIFISIFQTEKIIICLPWLPQWLIIIHPILFISLFYRLLQSALEVLKSRRNSKKLLRRDRRKWQHSWLGKIPKKVWNRPDIFLLSFAVFIYLEVLSIAVCSFFIWIAVMIELHYLSLYLCVIYHRFRQLLYYLHYFPSLLFIHYLVECNIFHSRDQNQFFSSLIYFIFFLYWI